MSLSLPKPVPALPKPVPTMSRGGAKPEPGHPARSRQQSRGANFNIGDPVNIGQQDFVSDMGVSPSDQDLFPNPPEKSSGPSTPKEETSVRSFSNVELYHFKTYIYVYVRGVFQKVSL